MKNLLIALFGFASAISFATPNFAHAAPETAVESQAQMRSVTGLVQQIGDTEQIQDETTGQVYDIGLRYIPGGSGCGQVRAFYSAVTNAIGHRVQLTGVIRTDSGLVLPEILVTARDVQILAN